MSDVKTIIAKNQYATIRLANTADHRRIVKGYFANRIFGGGWGKDMFSKEKFILKEKGGKRFAYATKKEALTGYIYRTQSCIWHTRRKLKMAETCLEKARKMEK